MPVYPVEFNVQDGAKLYPLKLRLDSDQMSQRFIIEWLQKTGTYEPELFRLILRVLREGDTFMDIGAHVGFFSVLAGHKVGPTGKVISVEPMAENQQVLDEHIKLNEFSHAHVFKGVISETDGTHDIYFNADNDGGHAFWDPGLHAQGEKSRINPEIRTVPSKKLTTLFNEQSIERAKLVKIDTEGAEVSILQGSPEILSQNRVDLMVCEMNGFALKNLGYTPEDLYECARSAGYEVYLMNDDGSLPRHLPKGCQIHSQYVCNVLFAKPETILTYWPVVEITPQTL